MGEIIEEFFTGYCRNFDMTQTVICRFEQSHKDFSFWIQAVNTGTAATVKTVLSCSRHLHERLYEYEKQPEAK